MIWRSMPLRRSLASMKRRPAGLLRMIERAAMAAYSVSLRRPSSRRRLMAKSMASGSLPLRRRDCLSSRVDLARAPSMRAAER